MDFLFALIDTTYNIALGSVWRTFLNDWLRWIYFGLIAVFAVIFIKDRAWLKLLSFIGIALVVGALIFFGQDFFGDRGNLTGAARRFGRNIG